MGSDQLVRSGLSATQVLGRRDAVSSPATCAVHGARREAATDQRCFTGKSGISFPLVRVALGAARRPARNLDSLAPAGLQASVAMEVAAWGHPQIPQELRELIGRVARENPLWSQERIANELLLKLGLRVSPRTVRKYLPRRPPGRPRDDKLWSIFLNNHAKAIVACDFFVAVTSTFQLLYVFIVMSITVVG